MKINLPTKITLIRIFLAVLIILGLIIFYILDEFNIFLISSLNFNLGNITLNTFMIIICGLFLIASFSDFLDGYIARKYNMVTDLGKFLDPIADKILINGLMIFLIFNFKSLDGFITFPWFLVVLMIIRDIVIDGLRTNAAKKGKVIAANIFGKAKTVFEMVAIVIILLNGFPFSFFDNSWPNYLHVSDFICYLTCAASLLSGVIYLKQNFNILLKNDK